MIQATTTGQLEEIMRMRAKAAGISASVDDEMKTIADELQKAAIQQVSVESKHASTGTLASGLHYEITRSPGKITVIFTDSAIYAGVQNYGSFRAVIMPEHIRTQKQVFGKYIQAGPKAVMVRSYQRFQNIPAKHFMERAIRGLPTVKSRIQNRVDREIANE